MWLPPDSLHVALSSTNSRPSLQTKHTWGKMNLAPPRQAGRQVSLLWWIDVQRECDLQALTKNESGTRREGGGGRSSSTVLPPWSATVWIDWGDRKNGSAGEARVVQCDWDRNGVLVVNVWVWVTLECWLDRRECNSRVQSLGEPLVSMKGCKYQFTLVNLLMKYLLILTYCTPK